MFPGKFLKYETYDAESGLALLVLVGNSPDEPVQICESDWMSKVSETSAGNPQDLFESWALPKSLHGPVSKQFELWAEQLAKEGWWKRSL